VLIFLQLLLDVFSQISTQVSGVKIENISDEVSLFDKNFDRVPLFREFTKDTDNNFQDDPYCIWWFGKRS
jgi:hypothetical protein